MADQQALKKTGKAGSNLLLWIIEMALKILAPVAAAISLGERGSFLSKIGTGLATLPEKIRELVQTLDGTEYVTQIINDYNSLTAAAFNEKYGGDAINYVMQYLNEGVAYLQNVYKNLSDDPVSTVLATLLVFMLLYLLSRLMRFVRQRGQGSVIDRMERKAGDKFFSSRP
jgi:predicted PurR-regulated permease PerM